jgi:hypothetical protein
MERAMTMTPNPRQNQYLWRLLLSGGEGYQKDLKVNKLTAAERDELVRSGLIEQEKHHRALFHRLGERGWSWIGEHMDPDFPPRSNVVPLLKLLLNRLDAYMKATGTPLSAIMSPQLTPGPSPAPEPEPAGDLTDAIRQAYLGLAGGRWNTRVRIADLRGALPDVARGTLDEELRRLQQNGALVLYSIDDPRDIGPQDQAAAVDVAGAQRHLVYMEG